ncbi:MAG: sugar phosphate isomerase/epimerase [Dehalococcoidia bacterium]
MTFKLGYSTYAIQMIDPFEALPKIREIGYDNLEICMGDAWPTAPERFPLDDQRRLSALARSIGFPSPIFFGGINVCALPGKQDSEVEKTLAKFRMAREIHYDDSPVLITTTAGHSAPPWSTGKDRIRDAFLWLADLAAEHDVTIAIEPHAGTDFETPEKAVWMMEQTRHPNLKLDLDVSHFHVEGSAVSHSVDLCAQHAAMVHVKDGQKVDGKIQFCLTGEGTIDLPEFVRSLKKNGLENLPIFAEVSVQQSRQPDYDPWRTAKFCYQALDAARKAVD